MTIDEIDDRSLAVAGVIDSHTTADLLSRIEGLGGDADVTLDLAEVEFIDSSGLRTLVSAHQSLDRSGAQLILTGISDPVDRLLAITGLREHLHIRE